MGWGRGRIVATTDQLRKRQFYPLGYWNPPKSLFYAYCNRFLLYHPIKPGKCKKNLQTELWKEFFSFFNSRFSEIKKKFFLPQREKSVSPVWARMGPFYIFGWKYMSYTRAVWKNQSDKSKGLPLASCQKTAYFLWCRAFLAGTVHMFSMWIKTSLKNGKILYTQGKIHT